MAYATLAGSSTCLWTLCFSVPVSIAAIFGSSRYLATGPVAMVSLLTSVAITSLSGGDSSLFVIYAMILALGVGVFQLVLALIKAGKILIKYQSMFY